MENTEKNRIINQVAIIGGEGKFGEFAGNLIRQTGIKVVNILENTTEQEKQEIINNSQVIIFSVPISQTVETIKSFADMLIGDKLVMDFTGLKSDAVGELKNLDVDEIVGTHPMFGPFGDNLKGKKIIFSEEKSGEKWKFVRRLLKKSGANLINLSPEEHDTKMAIIQALPNSLALAYLETLRDLNCDVNNNITDQILLSIRPLNQSSGLYADMQILNKFFIPVLSTLISNLKLFLDSNIKENIELNNDNDKIDLLEQFLSFGFIKAIEYSGFNIPELLEISTPIFNVQQKIVKDFKNPNDSIPREILTLFIEKLEKILNIIKNKNFDGFKELFDGLSEKFNSFKAESLEKTNEINNKIS